MRGGAGNGVRTRDIQLGRLTLYQLSYSRVILLRSASCGVGGGGRIRTFEGMSRQIYSLLPLAARAPLPTVVLPPQSRLFLRVPRRENRSPWGAHRGEHNLAPPAELAAGIEPATFCLQGRCSSG